MVGQLLEQSSATRDLRRTLELCEDLRDEAGRYGFQALQDAAALTLDEVARYPFREHWLKEGFELFHPVETL